MEIFSLGFSRLERPILPDARTPFEKKYGLITVGIAATSFTEDESRRLSGWGSRIAVVGIFPTVIAAYLGFAAQTIGLRMVLGFT